jgi:putative cell wall-binding protein
MISRLQAPMKAMGTAFVASLYGLLGSLIVGLMAYSAKKTAMQVMDEARELVADVLTDKPSMLIAKDGHNAQAVAAQWESLFHTLRNERNLLSDELTSMKELSRAQMALTEKGQLECTVLSNRQTGVLLQLKELATSQQELFKEQYVFLSEQAQLQRDAMHTQYALMSVMVSRMEHLTVEVSSLNESVSQLMSDQTKAQKTKYALIEAVEKTAETVSGALRALR